MEDLRQEELRLEGQVMKRWMCKGYEAYSDVEAK